MPLSYFGGIEHSDWRASRRTSWLDGDYRRMWAEDYEKQTFIFRLLLPSETVHDGSNSLITLGSASRRDVEVGTYFIPS